MSTALKELPKLVVPSGLLGRIVAVNAAVEKATRESGRSVPPRLVAVSKKQPMEKIQLAYREGGLRHFGENYVQELRDKAWTLQFGDYGDIKWHFIGHLQRNKIRTLLNISGLWMIESVDSIKLAHQLNKQWELEDREEKLNIMLQVNTSHEEGKSGCRPEESFDVAQYIMENCNNLNLSGLMTIGKFGHDYSTGPNPDFSMLLHCHSQIQCSSQKPLELSMGMSDDYLQAVSSLLSRSVQML